MAKEGRVLKILDEYRIVVSLGRGEVNTGDKLIVYALGDEISDEMGVSLGKLEIVKAQVEIEHVQEKFSTAVSQLVAETIRETVPEHPYYDYLSRIGYPFFGRGTERFRTEKRREPLPVEVPPPGIDRKIRVGDLVRLV